MILWPFANFQKFTQGKESGKKITTIGQLQESHRSAWQLAETLFSRQKAVTRWCVQNFKSIWRDMVISKMNKETKEIAFESYRGEILESLQNH